MLTKKKIKGLNIIRKIPQYKKVTKQDLRLAKYIQKMRKKGGLTQEELAEKVRKSVTWIGYIESGYRIPNLKLLYKISKALKIKVKDLFPF
ncbi:MAG: helix-turn-helix transcriptional regulator [Patescibacteria group bacterium]|nr:helix-turn-helix transcriptional regulator [Patescibacteria group bacterium]